MSHLGVAQIGLAFQRLVVGGESGQVIDFIELEKCRISCNLEIEYLKLRLLISFNLSAGVISLSAYIYVF